jgi:hypothetical protein
MVVESVQVGDLLEPPHGLLGVEEAQRAALEYISKGWAVTTGPGLDAAGVCSCPSGTRCRNPGKHARAGWGNEKRITMTAEQAETHFSAANPKWKDKPVDQVFIVPYLSGLVVADVDNEAAWAALDAEQRPETLWQASGSGRGGHRVYAYDWDLNEKVPPSLPGKLAGGAGEVKFRGIIAAAPSVHPSGGRYRWVNWGTEIAPAPKGLVERDAILERTAVDWSKIEAADKSDIWTQLLFRADSAGLSSAGDAKSARPLVLFAVAASMGVWIEAGFISKDEVISRLLLAAEQNGALDKYGETELKRQITNGIAAGIREKKT